MGGSAFTSWPRAEFLEQNPANFCFSRQPRCAAGRPRAAQERGRRWPRRRPQGGSGPGTPGPGQGCPWSLRGRGPGTGTGAAVSARCRFPPGSFQRPRGWACARPLPRRQISRPSALFSYFNRLSSAAVPLVRVSGCARAVRSFFVRVDFDSV